MFIKFELSELRWQIFLSMKNLRHEQCEGKISNLMFCKLKKDYKFGWFSHCFLMVFPLFSSIACANSNWNLQSFWRSGQCVRRSQIAFAYVSLQKTPQTNHNSRRRLKCLGKLNIYSNKLKRATALKEIQFLPLWCSQCTLMSSLKIWVKN